MTIEQLEQIVPMTKYNRLHIYLQLLNELMPKYHINTPLRQAAFIAQIIHESGGFHHKREIWGPTAAQLKYESRKDLGNTQQGDGERFKGRGLIQITGRSNYMNVGESIKGDINFYITNPELLELTDHATESACWFWNKNGLNELADRKEFIKITKRINGGVTGLADREKYYGLALKVLGA